MELTCSEILDDGCGHVVSGTSAHHLAEEIVAHTGTSHPHHLPGTSDDEVARHHERVLRRTEDMLAGGPGTPV
jgi:hypothetical protein